MSTRAAHPQVGIAAKLVLVISALSAVAMISLTVFMYNGTVNVLLSEELQRLNGSVDAAATRWQAGVDFYHQDVVFLAKVPPIGGIARARAAGGMDQLGGSTETVWKSRLQTIFSALLLAHDEYAQVRLIDVSSGREIVRVDRTDDGAIRTVPEAALQNKSDRPYFTETLPLARGEVHLSSIDLNVEFGEIERPYRPVMRVATKAFDDNGQPAGIIVINISMEDLFAKLQRLPAPSASFVTNMQGDYIDHPDPAKTYGYMLGRRHLLQDDYPELAALFAADGDAFSGTIASPSGAQLAVAKRVYFDPLDPQRFITLTQMSPRSLLAEQIAEVRNNTIVLAAVLLLLELAALIWISLLLTRPVRRITLAARAVANGERDVDLTGLITRRDEPGELARAFNVMVTNVAAKEQALDEKAKELERSNQELSQFAYIASHDMQEPLRMVASFLSLLQRRHADKLDAEANEFIDYAVDGATRMKLLINELLGYSRISNRTLAVSPVHLPETLQGIIKLLAPRIDELDATITIGRLPVVQADPSQMERLFRNLIENALKYHGEAKPKVSVSAKRQKTVWTFSVTDNGIGIDPAHSQKIFAIFSRLHSRDKYEGTGIGLAACRRIVERHGGTIWVDANPDGGSIFRFTLPTTPPTEEVSHEPDR
ncbi:ATP-binding protein [Devosia sp.]|uniref:sensor histidine kinase n=1 Tax=Devosia sp. TaxID=1871048 RepID=UPI003A956853